MSSEQVHRVAGMRTSARAVGSLQSNGAPTGLLLARVAGSHQQLALGELLNVKEVAT